MTFNRTPEVLASRIVSRNEGYIQNQVNAGVSDEDLARDLISKENIPEDMSVEELTHHIYAEFDILFEEDPNDQWGDADEY